MNNFVVTTFWTDHPYRNYRGAAEALGKSCEAQGIRCIVKERPQLEIHEHEAIWAMKGPLIQEVMDETGLPVWWADADSLLIDGARLAKNTAELVERRIDLAYHMFETNKAPVAVSRYGAALHWPAMGSCFFNNTEKGREVIVHWEEMHQQFLTEDDQMTMERATKATCGITWRNMPPEYYQMYDDKRYVDRTPVFKQMQLRRNPGYLNQENEK